MELGWYSVTMSIKHWQILKFLEKRIHNLDTLMASKYRYNENVFTDLHTKALQLGLFLDSFDVIYGETNLHV